MKPNSFTANLIFACLLLGNTDAKSLADSKTYLDKAATVLGSRPNSDRRKEFDRLWSIRAALSGDPAAARDRLLELLGRRPTDTLARDALAALYVPATP